MSESVNLPALGESVTEGTVTRWLKNVGDRVEVDEPLLEVSTDKVDTEIPSPVAGVIEEILVAEDETVEVGTALVKIGDGSDQGGSSEPEAPAEQDEAPAEQSVSSDDENAAVADAEEPEAAPSTEQNEETPAPAPAAPSAPAAQPMPAAQQAPAAPPAAAPAPAAAPVPPPPVAAPAAAPAAAAPAAASAPASAPSATVPNPTTSAAVSGYVTPLVRKLANEKGVDLSSVTGSGVGGRIRKEDVLEAADKAASASTPASTPASATSGPFVAEVSALRGTREKMSRLRKVVAERAVQSMQSTAQLTSVVEVDVTKVAQFRDAHKAEFQEKTGAKLSFLPFFALAASEALKAHPKLNATVDGDEIVYPPSENLAIAVDTERGLLTPVIRDAAELDLAGFATNIADLAGRTRDNQLKPDELSGGTFTLTNTGSRGALFDTPVVFLPQSAILGTGIVFKKPAVVKVDGQEAIAIRSSVYLALSYDHRIIDGADAARYLVAVKNRLEEGNFGPNLGY
ncbi:2-oxoglutarate dehydrogenase, E2 component, dihydrolipoamide succinyltransferase [Curtobacterium sp. Leaf261]|uniref:2-oxoglutarate dehydrogenase, E2 component, dihydrolipoamide succinyltransferase n=1 Tax=Curtobacterium sp. Leaf261 TaxID=1736311 RepID=UPI0007020C03|nr:2-oxoglutarate dehydrogenase, E2 component, dihydrolipoamide succinyltransferase [Curtobacterium sp. Leaf261]KQO64956.1 dihydrolipoamide succinyltransferase [Curtobacterium sp. Leaf261]